MSIPPKAIKLLATMIVLAAIALGQALPASAEALPTRKGGLWKQTTTMDQGEGPRDHVMTICIGEKMEHQTALASVKQHKDSCTKYDINVSDGRTRVQAECVFNGRPVASVTEMSGDFKTTFDIRVETRTTLTDKGHSRVMTRKINQVGSYIGSDCGELKPGEAMGSDGDRIMVQ